MNTSKLLSIGSALLLIAWAAFGYLDGLISGGTALPVLLSGIGVLGIHPNITAS